MTPKYGRIDSIVQFNLRITLDPKNLSNGALRKYATDIAAIRNMLAEVFAGRDPITETHRYAANNIVDDATADFARVRMTTAQFGLFNALLHAHKSVPYKNVRMNKIAISDISESAIYDLTIA